MLLEELFRDIKSQITGPAQTEIKGLSYDSRNISEGFVFFALNGAHANGSDFAQEAVSKGAVCVVSEKKIDHLNCANVIVGNITDAMSKASAKFYDYPDKKMTIIGVTGTNGKTSITYMTESIFKALNINIGVIGTINYRYAGVKIEAPNTTPQSLDLYKMMAEMVDSKIKYLIMEVSSHALALNRVKDIEFDIAVFTNLTRDHLDFHKNMDIYFEAKKLLFSSLKMNVKKNQKYAIINFDDIFGKKLLKNNDFSEKIYYSVNDGNAQCTACAINLKKDGSSFYLKSVFGNAEVNIEHIGLHNIYNMLAVFCICMAAGLKFNDVINHMKNASGAPGRFEKIDTKAGFTVIVDYAHTDDALANVLSAVKNLKPSRIITVFGCGGNRDKTKRPLMARTASELSDFVFITSDNPREEDPKIIAEETEAGIKNKKNYKVVIDREKAIENAVKMAEPGDIVVIAGKGHENYQIIGRTKIHFDDKEAVLSALKKLRKK